MSFLRWLGLLALAFWIGGLVALGAIAAPSLFSTLEAHDPSGGRELAAAAFGALFQRFQYGAWIAGVALLTSIGFRAALGPRPKRFGFRMWIAAAMLAASVATVFLITPHVEAIAASAGGAIVRLDATDPRRVAFNRWHGVSSGLMLATVLAGMGLLWAEVRDE
jgi:uncharacterized membrane protein